MTDANISNDMQPTKWKDHKTHLSGRGRYGSVTLTGADARRKRKEMEAAVIAALKAGGNREVQ